MIKVSTQIPAIYHKLHEKFGVNWSKGLAITYGDTVYSKNPVDLILAAHEEVHMKQQAKIGPEAWYEKYLNDDTFRLEQEVEAYRAQYKAMKRYIKDRNYLNKEILRICTDLSTMYGLTLSVSEAKALIS